jgi:hypothetical protein
MLYCRSCLLEETAGSPFSFNDKVHQYRLFESIPVYSWLDNSNKRTPRGKDTAASNKVCLS